MKKQISFVLPTKNEELSIGKVISSLRAETDNCGFDLQEVIVVDDSEDATAQTAEKSGARVVSGGGKGLGSAMLKGLKEAAKCRPDVIVSLDTDGQVEVSELARFVSPVLSKEADFVIGSRFLEKGLLKYSYPFINRQGVRILALFLRLMTGLKITDSHGGFRAMTAEVAEKLQIYGAHTYVQETIIDANKKGFQILEVPSVWLERQHGSSRVVGSILRYVLKTLPVLIKRIFVA